MWKQLEFPSSNFSYLILYDMNRKKFIENMLLNAESEAE